VPGLLDLGDGSGLPASTLPCATSFTKEQP